MTPPPKPPGARVPWALFPALLAAALTLPMWLHPDLWGTDRFFNEIRVVALSRCAMADGLWPAWLPDLAHGHGFPLFHYYPAGLYILARPMAALGLDPRSALLLVLTLAFMFSAWAVYGAIARRAGRLLGVCAAVLWVTAPYLQVDLQVRHAWAELLGLCFLPVALWGFLDLAEGERGVGAVLRAVGGLALTILSHNVVALLAAGGAVALWLGVALPRRDRGAILGTAAALASAFGLTAFFWLPALLDGSLVRVDQMSRGFYAMAEQGIYPAQLLGVGFGRGPSVPGPDDAMSLSVGLAQGLSFLALVAVALVRPRALGRSGHGPRGWLLVGLALALVALTLPFAAGAFDVLPLLHHVQAPFRLLGPLALVLAWAVPLLAAALLPARSRKPAAGVVMLLAVATAAPYFGDIRTMTAAETADYQPVREAGLDGVARLADPYTTTAGFLEYLPKTVVRYPTEPSPAVQVPPWMTAEVISRRCERLELSGSASQPGVVRVGAFDFPGVEVLLNGQPVAHRTDPDLGFILAPVTAAGPWTMEVRHSELGSSGLGRAVSLLSLIALGLLALRRRRR
ncbi:MAG: hypothetical protein R3F39_26005 [Myxococcota bacterium]